jgi:hypothetical protein
MVSWFLENEQTLTGEKKRSEVFPRTIRMVHLPQFVLMYDEVYEAMVNAKVATELTEPIWVNEKQEESNKNEKFGRKATHLLVKPDYVIFVDECGCIQVKREMVQ